jgi:hypothetical protein
LGAVIGKLCKTYKPAGGLLKDSLHSKVLAVGPVALFPFLPVVLTFILRVELKCDGAAEKQVGQVGQRAGGLSQNGDVNSVVEQYVPLLVIGIGEVDPFSFDVRVHILLFVFSTKVVVSVLQIVVRGIGNVSGVHFVRVLLLLKPQVGFVDGAEGQSGGLSFDRYCVHPVLNCGVCDSSVGA